MQDDYSAFPAVELCLSAILRSLPNDLDYSSVRGLSKEVQIKLAAQRPETLGQAGRIAGVTPAAMSLLLVHLKRGRLVERVA